MKKIEKKRKKLKKIKTLIVGLGKVGFEYDKNHIQSSHILTHSKALKKNKNYKLIGGVDIDKKKRILSSTREENHTTQFQLIVIMISF